MEFDTLQLKCTNLNVRGERKGDSGDIAVAVDISLSSSSLSLDWLKQFMDLDSVHLAEMQAAGVGTVSVFGDHNHHDVTIRGAGELPTVILADAKVSKIVAELGDHEKGFMGLALRVQGRPKTRTDTGKLAELINGDVAIAVKPGADLFADSDDKTADG